MPRHNRGSRSLLGLIRLSLYKLARSSSFRDQVEFRSLCPDRGLHLTYLLTYLLTYERGALLPLPAPCMGLHGPSPRPASAWDVRPRQLASLASRGTVQRS